MRQHGIPEFGNALTRGTHCGNNGGSPCIVRQVGQFEHLFNIAARFFNTLTVGFVNNKNIGNFHEACFIGLHRVAPTWVQHHHRGVGLAGNFYLYLANTHCFNNDPTPTYSIEQTNSFWCCERQATQVTARCHRANENSWVCCVVLHAHAVAQNGPTRKR